MFTVGIILGIFLAPELVVLPILVKLMEKGKISPKQEQRIGFLVSIIFLIKGVLCALLDIPNDDYIDDIGPEYQSPENVTMYRNKDGSTTYFDGKGNSWGAPFQGN